MEIKSVCLKQTNKTHMECQKKKHGAEKEEMVEEMKHFKVC